MLRGAIVGLGWWGREIVAQVQGNSKRIRFTRGVTLEMDAAADLAREHGFELTDSYEAVLADPEIDAVVLATPHSLHRAQVEAAAAAGKHVFCEKPFALTLADARASIAACREAGVALGVGHNRRLWPSIARMKEMVAGGEIGTIMLMEGTYSHDWLAHIPPEGWRSDPDEAPAGGMTGMGIHLLDCFQHFAGPITSVQAHCARRVLERPSGDTTTGSLEFACGALGLFSTTLMTPFVWRCAVFGSHGWLESTSETRLTICRKEGDVETVELPQENHICANIDSFAAEAMGEGRFQVDDEGILATVAALEATFASVRLDGDKVRIG